MNEHQGKRPLDYHRPRRVQLPLGAQAVIGAVVTTMVLALIGFLIGLLALSAPGKAGYLAVVVICTALVVAATVETARRQQRDPLRRGWAIGTLIGLGVALLIDGICFMSLT